MINSPRRKSLTPRRLRSSTSSPASSIHSQPLNPASNLSSNYSDTYSSAGTDSSEIDVQAFIDKSLIVNKFLQTTTKDEKWATKIANKINQFRYNNGTSVHSNTEPLDEANLPSANQQQTQTNDKLGRMEIDFSKLCSSPIQEIVVENTTNALNDDSEFNQFIDDLVLSSPFNLLHPSSTTTLNTPNSISFTPIERGSSSNKENHNRNNILPVVKNLLNDLSHQEENKLNSLKNEDSITSQNTSNSLNTSQLSNSSNSSFQTVVEAENTIQNKQQKTSSEQSKLMNTSIDQSKKELPKTASDDFGKESTNTIKESYKIKRAISKPVFHNQHLNTIKRVSSFARLINDQKFIKASTNYSGPSEVVFESGNNNNNPTANHTATVQAKSSPQKLTTFIDLVEETNNKQTGSAVHTIDSNVIQIQNNQIQYVNQADSTSLVQQQSGQLYYSSSEPTLWDPSTIDPTQQMIILPISDGNFSLTQINPQITTTSQNIYYRIVSNTEQQTSLNPTISSSNSFISNDSSNLLLNPPASQKDVIIEKIPKTKFTKVPSIRPSILSKPKKRALEK